MARQGEGSKFNNAEVQMVIEHLVRYKIVYLIFVGWAVFSVLCAALT